MTEIPENTDRLFTSSCTFIGGAAAPEQVPESALPEIAFAGRSNVGKSSLINALTGRKALARVSHTPGRTQQINFFDIGNRFMLADMPGYGYAKVPKAQKASWDRLIRLYLRGRPNLRCVFVLVDARHGLKNSDHEILKLLDESAVATRVVLTKTDECKTDDLDVVVSAVRTGLKRHTAAFPEPLITSSHDRTGLDDVRAVILSVVQ